MTSASVSSSLSSWRTVRRGLALSPSLREGLPGTIALALLAMVGRVSVPIAVQLVIDHGLDRPTGPDWGVILAVVGAALLVVGVTIGAQYLMMTRLFTASETALAGL